MSTSKRKRQNSDRGTYLPLNVKKSIDILFKRKFCYEQNTTDIYDLNKSCGKPKFNGKLQPCWQVKKYLGFKKELNDLKNNLNDKHMLKWHEHTRKVNLAGNIAPEIRHSFRPELCTQAWCKFYEIASTFLDVDLAVPYFSVHLCEAPGAFVTSLNHFLHTKGFKSQWRWLASTLNPYYEGNDIGQMIDDDRFIRCSLDNWYFGVDGTGNLMSQENLQGLCDKLTDCHVDLVTADGSIDCQWNPAEQESVVSRLQYCETLAALNILSPGGTFILKMFTLLECQSLCLIYLLNCVFNKVHLFKPCTSKGGNSEVYVVCKGYHGNKKIGAFLEMTTPVYFGSESPVGCLFDKEDIPPSFFDQHDRCTEFYKDCQMTSIQRNLDLYDDPDLQGELCNERSSLNAQKDYCLECFFQHYDIQLLGSTSRVMKMGKRCARKDKSGQHTQFAERVTLEGKFTGNFQERQMLSTLPWQQKVQNYDTYEEEVDCEDNSLWIQCMAGTVTERDVDEFDVQLGRPIHKIASSYFCHGFYIQRMLEITDNVKWLKEPQSVDDQILEKAVKGIVISLDAAIRSQMAPLEHHSAGNGTTVEWKADTNVSSGVDSSGDTTGSTDQAVSSGFSCVIQTKPSELLKKLAQQCPASSSTKQCVRMYSVVSEGISQQFEITTQRLLCETILDILKTSNQGDTVLLELETSLTRVTAALIYCLYRSFTEIGFIHNHGNLLRRHLVCVSFKHCPMSLQQYLESCYQQMVNDQSASVLEVIPISVLLQDSDFSSFLHISNSSLLKSAITTIVFKERHILGLRS